MESAKGSSIALHSDFIFCFFSPSGPGANRRLVCDSRRPNSSPEHNPLRREPMARVLSNALSAELQRLASSAGFEPATLWLLVCRSIPRPHHAANSSNFCRSSLVACCSLSFRERRQRVAANAGAIGPCRSDEKFREESALTVYRESNPKPCGFSDEVTVNFTIPGCSSRGECPWIETT